MIAFFKVIVHEIPVLFRCSESSWLFLSLFYWSSKYAYLSWNTRKQNAIKRYHSNWIARKLSMFCLQLKNVRVRKHAKQIDALHYLIWILKTKFCSPATLPYSPNILYTRFLIKHVLCSFLVNLPHDCTWNSLAFL